MDTVRKDLRQKIETMEKIEKEKRKNNDIKIVTSERDFFRQEAIRLNQLCKDLSARNEDIVRENKFQINELTSISKKFKESENTNKQLMAELERNIQINKELEFHLKITQENMNFNQIQPHNPYEAHNEEENFDIFNKEKIIRFVEKLKIDLKKEKTRNHKILAELNKIMLDQNKLEKIFIDCVEECRKDIFNRKFRESFSGKSSPLVPIKPQSGTMPFINEVKYENFLSSDKRKLIETFIMKEEVINLIKDYVFKKIDGNSIFDGKDTNELSQTTKNSFMKTDRMFSMTNFKKKSPPSGLTYTMQINNRAKTPNLNII